MKKKLRTTVTAVLALCLAVSMTLTLTACGGTGKNQKASDSSQDGTTAGLADQIIVGTLSDPKYIDPNAPGVGPAEINVTQQIYEGLVSTGKDGSIEPLLASDWIVSDDGLTYTFHLIPDVKFSDGTPVTGADWQWSLYRARDYQTSNYRFIAEAIDRVDATDSQVVIHLKEPHAPFLAELANFNMVVGSKAHWDAVGDASYLKNPLGTGPYMVKEWKQGENLILTANPYYHEKGYPKTKEIKYLVVADDNTRLMQLQNGQIDVINTLPFSMVPMIQSNPELKLDVFPSTQIYYLILNTTKKPFNDPKVRQAMNYAINKQELSDTIAGEYGSPVAALVSATQGKWSNQSLKVIGYDPSHAKQLLTDAGYTKPVEFTITVRTGSAFYEQIATLIQSQVNQAGFHCTIETLESAAVSDKFESLNHQATVLQWVDDIQDPSGVVGWSVDYDQAHCFYTGLNDKVLEQLNASALKELDESKRVQMYQDIQQKIYENSNIIPLYRNDFAFATSAKIQGLYVSPFYVYQAKNWTKSK